MEAVNELFAKAKESPLQMRIDVDAGVAYARSTDTTWNSQYAWSLSEFESFVIKAGGLLEAMGI
jgi:hypothetical protein